MGHLGMGQLFARWWSKAGIGDLLIEVPFLIMIDKEKKIYICSNGHKNETMVKVCKVCGCPFIYMRSQTITKPAKVRTK